MANTTKKTLLVTGASGQLGRRVVELLLERGAGPVVATTRSPAKLADLADRGVIARAADFDDEAGLAAAFAGAERALLVSTDAVDAPGKRLAQHRRAIRALEAAGVKHVVYTSLPNPVGSPITIAPDHAETEAALAASTLDFTILRNNLYVDLSLQSFQGAIASGQLIDSRENGATAFVLREDCARAAAAALAGTRTGRSTYDVTGPAALTSAEVAALLTEVTGKPVRHVSVPTDAQIAGLVQHGLPRPIAELIASFDLGVARGDLATATTTVEDLTGRAPTSVRDWLIARRAQLV